MIVDSSVWVALVRQEHDAEDLRLALVDAARVHTSAASLLEASIVVSPARHQVLDELLELTQAVIVPFDGEQAIAAREAYARYGKGSGSKARLNFGDCIAYALAKVSDEPLLFTGEDFRHTDVTPAP